MTLVREYKPLFRIRAVRHGPGAKPIETLKFAPTQKCRAALRDHGLLFKRRPNGFDVYYTTNPASVEPLLGSITSLTRLTFTIQGLRPGALDEFEPSPGGESGHQLYFDNLRADFKIKLNQNTTMAVKSKVGSDDVVMIRPRLFVLTASPPLPDEYAVTPAIGDAQPKTFDDVSASTDLDMRDRPEGVYKLTEQPGGNERLLYLDDEVGTQSVVGVVDLYWESPQSTVAVDGLLYRITFKPKAA